MPAQVVASELGLKAVGSSANVEVNLVDVNDHRPIFRNFNSKNGRHYEVPLHEQAKAGAIVTKVNYKYSTKKRASRASALRTDGVSYTMGLVLTYPISPIPWT